MVEQGFLYDLTILGRFVSLCLGKLDWILFWGGL